MVAGRVLIVHESAATRGQLVELLARAGLRVESVESTFACMARYVDARADLVLLGLAGLDDAELELIRTLKREEIPPRVLVAFPSPLRDLAVRALEAGADGYVPEPFYGAEVVALVLGQLAEQPSALASKALVHLAHEVAHAVNNPLQVMTLLLQKDRVTKKEIVEGLPEHLARIERVVRMLREFGDVGEAQAEAHDPRPIVERIARKHGALTETASVPSARIDPRLYEAGLEGLFDALALRAGEGFEPKVLLKREQDAAVLRVVVPRRIFGEEDPAALPDAVFVVRADREVLPGLARARAMIEAQNGALAVRIRGEDATFIVRVPAV